MISSNTEIFLEIFKIKFEKNDLDIFPDSSYKSALLSVISFNAERMK